MKRYTGAVASPRLHKAVALHFFVSFPKAEPSLRTPKRFAQRVSFSESVSKPRQNVALRLPFGYRDNRQVLKWIDAIRGRSDYHSSAPAMSWPYFRFNANPIFFQMQRFNHRGPERFVAGFNVGQL